MAVRGRGSMKQLDDHTEHHGTATAAFRKKRRGLARPPMASLAFWLSLCVQIPPLMAVCWSKDMDVDSRF